MGLLSFVGFLDLSAKLPLEFWASILLSAGLAVQSARSSVPAGLPPAARVTAPLLAGAVLASCWRRRQAPGRSTEPSPHCRPRPRPGTCC